VDRNPYAPPASEVELRPQPPAAPSLDNGGPRGLGGWLVLVALGLFASPIRLGLVLSQVYSPLFSDGTWESLTSPSGDFYHPAWAPILLTEMLVNLLFIAASIYLMVLFFRTSERFPMRYAIFLASSLAFVLLDAVAVKLVLPDEPILDPETTKELLRAAVAAGIWIPYMFLSRRVKNTFVRTAA
jgi:hypothetical protein